MRIIQNSYSLRLADRLAELETRSGSDESTSTRITPQQHSEPTRKMNGNGIVTYVYISLELEN